MSNPAGAKGGATKGKLILIAVLAAVLVGVIVSNLSTGEESAAPAAASEQAAAAPASTPAVAPSQASPEPVPSGPFREFAEDVEWPQVTLEDATKYDPLAVPAWAGPPPPSDVGTGREFSEEQIAEINDAENAIIFVSGNRRVALIGTQEFHVGDMIGGMKISDISSRGIVLSDPE